MGRADRVERALEAAAEMRLAAATVEDERTAHRLRRAERLVLWDVGPSVPKSRAARLLGVSTTALQRWIRSGRLPAVRRPRGREEVDAGALLDILAEVRRVRDEGGAAPRAVSRAFRHLAERGLPRPKLRPNQTARELRDAYQRSSPVERLGETAELSHAATALARYGARRRRGTSDPV
jgi:helix-turn-helix protein